jgi:tetratricopeptide (TPR) repeat protein
MKGMRDEALAHVDKALSIWPTMDDAILLSQSGWVYAKCGEQEKARELLERMMGLKGRILDPFCVALIYTGLGQKNEALDWLTKGYEAHSGLMVYLKVYAQNFFKDVSPEPRYREILRKMGFDE